MSHTVCQLVHGLPVGGTEVLVDRFVRRMSEGRRVVVACLDEVGELGERLRADGFDVTLLGRAPGFDGKCVRRLASFLRRERVDLLHAHQYTPFAYALAARVFGARQRLLFTEHGRFFPDYPSWKRKLLNRVMSRRGDRFFAVGEAVRRALIENEGLPADRVDVVYNGVNLDPLAAPHDRREARSELGIGSDEFVVLQVARLDPIKDHATALASVEEARRNNPKIRLLLVGDGPERRGIEAEVSRRGLGDAVRLLGSRGDVPRLLAAADAFLLTSVSEGIPVTVIEAMGAGVPVVSTAVGGVPEILQHGRSGFLAPAGAATQLASLLVELSRNDTAARSLAEQAKRDAEDRFSERRMMDRYEEVYDEMLRSRRPRRERIATRRGAAAPAREVS